MHIISHFFLEINVSGLDVFIFVNKVIPCNYLSKSVPYKNSPMLLGDHVCGKFDALKWIFVHDYHIFDYIMLMSSN